MRPTRASVIISSDCIALSARVPCAAVAQLAEDLPLALMSLPVVESSAAKLVSVADAGPPAAKTRARAFAPPSAAQVVQTPRKVFRSLGVTAAMSVSFQFYGCAVRC